MTKVLRPFLLHVEDARDQRAGLGNEKAAGLKEQAAVEAGERAGYGGGVVADARGGVGGAAVVLDAEAAAGVDGADVDAVAAELADELVHTIQRSAEGLGGADLRADVDADAVRDEPSVFRGAAVERGGAADVDAELVLAQAGGDVGMGFREHIGVDAKSEASLVLELCGARGEQIELGFALHVEFENSGLEGVVDLGLSFAHAGEDDTINRFGRGGEDAVELATGDNVKAGAVRGQQLENRQRGVGLYGVADEVIAA